MQIQFSAGGLLYKKNGTGQLEILVSQHSQHHGWVFPKGLIGDKIAQEGKEETALREVEEETGAKGKIIKELTPVTYFYKFDNQTIKKTVYYYLMEYIGGDITKHDWEMENVEWLPVDKVEQRLTYESDKEVWGEAKKIIHRL